MGESQRDRKTEKQRERKREGENGRERATFSKQFVAFYFLRINHFIIHQHSFRHHTKNVRVCNVYTGIM